MYYPKAIRETVRDQQVKVRVNAVCTVLGTRIAVRASNNILVTLGDNTTQHISRKLTLELVAVLDTTGIRTPYSVECFRPALLIFSRFLATTYTVEVDHGPKSQDIHKNIQNFQAPWVHLVCF